ncbi:MAG: polysaccharide biosynthesis C-terminal domain-containing protein [Saprospiraceae bacterium]|nr:polysaccharide biosynthesis C-terminal domain-containing protein [Saprospiraceae bacterium]
MNRLKKYYFSISQDSSKGFQAFSVIRQLAVFLVGVLLAKSSLSTDEIGTYEIWMFIGMIISFTGLSGILQAFLAMYGKENVEIRASFIFNTLLIIWIGTISSALLIYFTQGYFFRNFLAQEVIKHLPLVLIFLLLHLNSIFAPYVKLVENKAAFFVPYSIFFLTGNVLAVLIPLWNGQSLPTLLYSLLIWSLIEQFVLMLLLVPSLTFKVSLSTLKRISNTAIPLSLYSGLGLLAQIFDAWLVNYHFKDLSVFAIFRYGAKEIPGAVALASAFSASMVALFVMDERGGLKRLKEGSLKFMHIFFPLSIVLVLFSDNLFSWMYNDDFRRSADVFNVYVLLMLSRWVFPQVVLMGLGKHKDIFWVSVIELFCNILLSLILVNYWGIAGVAVGTLIAFWLEKLIMVYLLQIRYNINVNDYIPSRYFLLYSISLVCAFFWKSFY